MFGSKKKQKFASQSSWVFIKYYMPYVFRFGLLALLAVTIVWTWVKLHSPMTLPVKDIKVEGNYRHISQDTLKSVLLPYVTTGFFDVDITAVKTRLLLIPWVADVEVSRVWPQTLIVTVMKQNPVAIWNGNSLMNAEGDIFSPGAATFPGNMPILIGSQGQQLKVWQNYLAMQALLRPLGLTIANITLSSVQDWQVQFENGAALDLGQEDNLEKLKRFIDVFPKVFIGHFDQVNYVDMRYTDGMAVSWKPTVVNSHN